MSLELKIGQTSIGTLVVTDTVTGLPVAATFDSVAVSGFDASISEVTVNPDNTLKAVGIGAGTTTGNINANASFSDSNGHAVSSQPLATTETIAVDSPAPHPVSLSISWSTPA